MTEFGVETRLHAQTTSKTAATMANIINRLEANTFQQA